MSNHINPVSQRRFADLIDDRLFTAFWDGAKHFGTTDLVLFYDESLDEDPVSIMPRLRLINDADLPASLLSIINKASSTATKQLNSTDVSFWFIVYFQDGEMVHGAINAKLIGPGGIA
ncbi:hypothetical protein [Methylophilus sp. Q8]|uniref:hypothetical protein n=1 Tax=Methylophilus sp. Q8 TaxID=1506586 RepID=UPI000648A5F6|nr:hypothetical protein [Methylophilus sp. Q8]